MLTSSTGEAQATSGCLPRRPYSFSSNRAPPPAPNDKSAWPETERTACANSSKADALIKCTAKASATPSITDTTAAALRQGCWRSSCQEKLVSRGHKGLRAGRCAAVLIAPPRVLLRLGAA